MESTAASKGRPTEAETQREKPFFPWNGTDMADFKWLSTSTPMRSEN